MIAANPAGVSGTLFYLAAYGFSTLGAFAFVSMVRDRDGGEQTELAQLGRAWAGAIPLPARRSRCFCCPSPAFR